MKIDTKYSLGNIVYLVDGFKILRVFISGINIIVKDDLDEHGHDPMNRGIVNIYYETRFKSGVLCNDGTREDAILATEEDARKALMSKIMLVEDRH